MQTIIDKNLINYEALGTNKNTILILHGWKRSLNEWRGIAASLSEKNRVVLIDLPGFGNSTNPEKEIFDLFGYAGLINKFINKLKLRNIILIGHSFGGQLSIAIASKNKKVRKLILVDTSGIRKRSLVTKIKILVAKAFKNAFFIPKSIRQYGYEKIASRDYKNAESLRESFKKIIEQDISENAKKIKIPTLIIWGENDKEVPISLGKALQSLIENSTFRIVWRADHHPHLEKPEKFLEIIEEFI